MTRCHGAERFGRLHAGRRCLWVRPDRSRCNCTVISSSHWRCFAFAPSGYYTLKHSDNHAWINMGCRINSSDSVEGHIGGPCGGPLGNEYKAQDADTSHDLELSTSNCCTSAAFAAISLGSVYLITGHHVRGTAGTSSPPRTAHEHPMVNHVSSKYMPPWYRDVDPLALHIFARHRSVVCS